jgi:hypothetical protein
MPLKTQRERQTAPPRVRAVIDSWRREDSAPPAAPAEAAPAYDPEANAAALEEIRRLQAELDQLSEPGEKMEAKVTKGEAFEISPQEKTWIEARRRELAAEQPVKLTDLTPEKINALPKDEIAALMRRILAGNVAP